MSNAQPVADERNLSPRRTGCYRSGMNGNPETWLRAAVGALTAGAWSALLLGELGFFHTWISLLVGVASFVAIVRFVPVSATSGVGARWWLPALLAAACAVGLAGRPGELILGGWDPGVYLHTAAHLARTGHLLIREPDLLAMPAGELAVLTRTTSGIVGPFTGLWQLPDGSLSPQFHHLYPSLLAVASSMGGVRAALMVNPLLSGLCVLAAFSLALRMVRPCWALAATILLAANPAQLWQAGFPTAEMFGQLLLLTAAGAFLDAWREDRPASGVFAGLAFGASLLARYDAILLLAPLTACTVCAWPWSGRPRAVLFGALAFAVPAAHQAIHFRLFAPYYNPAGPLLLPALLALGVGGVAWLLAMRLRALRDVVGRVGGTLVPLAGLLMAAAWAVWLWGRAAGWIPAARGDEDARNALFLVAIFGPGVAALVAALLFWLQRERDVAVRIWLFASLAATMLVSAKVYNDHFLPWVARRFVPVTLPLFILAGVVAVNAIARERRSGAALGVLALGLLTALHLPASRAMAVQRDWPGLVTWCERVAQAVPAESRLFTDQRGFGAPFRFLHGLRAYELHLSDKDPGRREALSAVIRSAVARGDRAYFLSSLGPLPGLAQREVMACPLTSQRSENDKLRFPTSMREAGGPFVLYEVLR